MPFVLLLSCLVTATAADSAAFLASGNANSTVQAPAVQLASSATQFAIVEQPGARIHPGGRVRLFFIGTSNVLWNTWVDQTHLLLNQLGYATPLVDSQGWESQTRPLSRASCDDNDLHGPLQTQRIGQLGWSSWGFAYEDKSDCDARGYRHITGHSVSCTNSWMCEPQFTCPVPLVKPSDIARIASQSEVTVLSNWVNDFTARYPGSICFNKENVGAEDASLTVDSLLRTIRAIHRVNSNVVVVVMARYAGAGGRRAATDPTRINAAVRAGLAGEPNTLFADFTFPRDQDMYLMSRSGHPNCRGDKVMALAVIQALYQGKVIGRSLSLDASAECPRTAPCETLSSRCCQHSVPMCWPRPDGRCASYSSGED